MKKRDFETYHKRFRDFEILTKFSETHVFRGTIRHPYIRQVRLFLTVFNFTSKPSVLFAVLRDKKIKIKITS